VEERPGSRKGRNLESLKLTPIGGLAPLDGSARSNNEWAFLFRSVVSQTSAEDFETGVTLKDGQFKQSEISSNDKQIRSHREEMRRHPPDSPIDTGHLLNRYR
jgi:hypothetical protein